MILWKGAPVAAALTEESAKQVAILQAEGIAPKLAVVRVGAREDDLSYERGLTKRFAMGGAAVDVHALAEDASQETVEACVRALNDDASVHGILLFSPLPRTLQEERIRALISPHKDVDCMGDRNAFCVYAGVKREDAPGYPPCTPQAVLEMLDFYGYDLCGKNVTVVGRSAVVGKPLAMLLLQRNATVTVCHTRTRDLPTVCRNADLLVVCAGKAGLVGAECVREGMAVVDVGIHVVDGALCGDVAASVADALGEDGALTPVPGGVGSVTTSVLLKHTVLAASRK